MENFNTKAVSEVIEILNHTDKEIVEKIPQKFIEFLFENEDNDYKPNIDFYDEQWEKSIQEDTQAILAMIYRDYIVSEDEKIKLLNEEQEEKLKQERELREKYNPDNLFKKHSEDKNVAENDIYSKVAIVEYKESIFKRFINKIKNIFHIK